MSARQQIEIEVVPRDAGKTANAALRAAGNVPGVVYSPRTGSLPLAANQRALAKYLTHKYENTIFTLKSKDSKLNNLKVLFKEKDLHPVRRELIHFDFYAVDMTQAVRVNVEVRFTGKPIGLTDGGSFQAVLREVEVECLPDLIPDFFEIDTSGMGVNESLHVSDLKTAEGVKLVTDGSVTLCTVSVIREEEAAPVAAAAAEAAPAEPEVIGKGKKKEGEEGAAPAAAPAAGAKTEKK